MVRTPGRCRERRRRLVATAGLTLGGLVVLVGLGGFAPPAFARGAAGAPATADPPPALGAFAVTAHVTGETAGYTPGSRFTVTYDCGAGAIGAFQIVDGDTEAVDSLPVGTVCHLAETARPATTDASYAWSPEVWNPSDTVTVTADPQVVILTNPLHRVWGGFTVTARVTGATAGYVAGSAFAVGYECSTGVSGTLQLADGETQGVGALPLGTACTLTERTKPATAGSGYAFGPESFSPAATLTVAANDHANTVAVVVTNPLVQTSAPTTTTASVTPTDPTTGAVAVLGETATAPTLPRTGPSDTLLLAAIGVALIVGGVCFVAASRIDP